MRFGLIVALAGALGAFLVATVALVVAASGASEPETSGASRGQAKTVTVEEGEFFVRPSELHVEVGDEITLSVKNTGTVPHDLVLDDRRKTALIDGGGSATLALGRLEAGSYVLKCSVPGHAELGMSATLMVAAGDEHSATSGTAPASGAAMSSAQMDEEYIAGVRAYPAATKGLGNQPLAPALDGATKVFDLTADEIDWEVEPGVVRKDMAYNGQVPGPIIRVRIGDRVRVVLHNRLEESTAIHFHGLVVPNAVDGVPGITQPLVKPGESFTYEFTVRNSGSHMYHSHMNGALQIPAGLLGAFIVEGPNEPASDIDQLMILNDGPLGYTINGKGFPATAPIVAKPGQKVRLRYMNEGLQIHPMHLHGMPQQVVARDGYPVPQPYLLDTVLVAPGERVDVIVDASELGVWALHCHVLSHAENEHGMFGMVTAMIVQ